MLQNCNFLRKALNFIFNELCEKMLNKAQNLIKNNKVLTKVISLLLVIVLSFIVTFVSCGITLGLKVVYNGELPKAGCEYKYIGKLLENPNDAAITFVKNRINSMKNCMCDIEKVERKQELFNELKLAVEEIENHLKNIAVNV